METNFNKLLTTFSFLIGLLLCCVCRHRARIVDVVRERLSQRFKVLESKELMKAAAKLGDPREWPEDHDDLAVFGLDELRILSTHFEVCQMHSG